MNMIVPNNRPKVLRDDEVLVVPDVHCNLDMLNEVYNLAKKRGIKHIFFIGDYFNTYGEYSNDALYLDTLYLLEEINKNFSCTFIVGNHDVSYIFDERYKENYHAASPQVRHKIHVFFEGLRSRGQLVGWISYGSFLLSHAGVKGEFNSSKLDTVFQYPRRKYINEWFQATKDESSILIGRIADWEQPRFLFKTQIFGHTPVGSVWVGDSGKRICLDTWSLDFFLDSEVSNEELVKKKRELLSNYTFNPPKELLFRGNCSLIILKGGGLRWEVVTKS